jgi:hypothetical protein
MPCLLRPSPGAGSAQRPAPRSCAAAARCLRAPTRAAARHCAAGTYQMKLTLAVFVAITPWVRSTGRQAIRLELNINSNALEIRVQSV